MSHIVTIATKCQDFAAISAACRRLHLAPPIQGTANLFSGEATGIIIRLPDWQYPAVIDTASGEIRYDNYGGSRLAQEQMDLFLQSYAAEKVKIEANKRGYAVSEQQLQDGSIKLQIVERAS